MSELRFNFLNWRPDIEDEGHDGLSVADNCYHDVDGYKQIRLASAGAFSTNTAVGTCLSIQIRSLGVYNDQVAAWINPLNASTAALRVGTYESGVFSGSASSTLTSLVQTAGALVCKVISFQAAELGEQVVLTAVAEGATSASTTSLAFITGYLSI